jgi:hypothetical protein
LEEKPSNLNPTPQHFHTNPGNLRRFFYTHPFINQPAGDFRLAFRLAFKP